MDDIDTLIVNTIVFSEYLDLSYQKTTQFVSIAPKQSSHLGGNMGGETFLNDKRVKPVKTSKCIPRKNTKP